MIPKGDAIVKVYGHFRLAIQVFRTKDGVAWLEPDYLIGDGGGSGGFHRLECAVVENERGLDFRNEHGFGYIIAREKIMPGEEADRRDLYPFIEEYNQALARLGRTRKTEARRMKRHLAYDLSCSMRIYL